MQEPATIATVEEGGICRHRWLIASPNGPTSEGVCRLCGARRDFRNSGDDFIGDGVPSRTASAADRPSPAHAISAGYPGPWGEAAKGIFRLKGIPFVLVRQVVGQPNDELCAWTGQRLIITRP